MGWFKELLGTVAGSAPNDLTFVSHIQKPGAVAQPIVADDVYIELFVDSLRIDKARSFATRFHGIVYCFGSLARLAEEDASFASVTKPDKLAELDKDSVGKVMTITKRMMGPLPWRGGNFELQLGLFSVKSGNVLTPLLNFVTKVSDAAGISFVSVARPFLPLISEGMDLIAGQTADTKLVVGVDISMQPQETVTCAVIARKKEEIDTSALAIDPADGKLLLGGAPLDAAYCVFSLRATERKSDWGEIPELKESYAALRKVLNGGKADEAEEAFLVFKRKLLTSPDLIGKDADQLVAKARALVDALFAPDPRIIERGQGAPQLRARGDVEIPSDFAALDLYGFR